MELSGPRWKGKNFAKIAHSNPMTEIIAELKDSLANSESTAFLISTDFLLETTPELTNLLNRTSFGRCLKISINNTTSISSNDLWSYMRATNELFPIYYRAYMHLRSKNRVVKSGTKNGVNFVVYRHHPALVHSEYAVVVVWENEKEEKTMTG